MTLVLLLILAGATAFTAAALTWRWAASVGRGPAPTLDTARRAGTAIRHEGGTPKRLAARLDPGTATGLALTLALVVIVAGGVLLAMLAYLIRGDTDLVRFDASVAEWGQRHAAPWSTDVLEAISHLGEPKVVIVLAGVLAVVETIRTRSRWVVPFLFVVVAGNGVLTTIVKELADRVRPEVNPIAETLGPSFPSGHSSWSAAFWAAAALLLCRGRPHLARAALVGAAAALAITVAGTRVLLGVHWLSDVIAGLALGAAWFSVCAIAFGGRLLRFGAAAAEAARAAEGRPPKRAHVAGGHAARPPVAR